MHDHRLPRHDRPPEPWLPHPGTPEASSPPQMLLGGGDYAASRPAAPAWTGSPTPLPTLPANASPFARFVVGLVSGRKSIPLAIALAFIGPLGLFYVSILHGVAALVVVSVVVRPIAIAISAAIGGQAESLSTVAVILCWCITVPWAIVAARRRNARIAKA
jgi:hypothetical protein